jgi:GNAT superfamily N-acetyltransferase
MMGDRQAPDLDPAIRRARSAEVAALSRLALRSKAHWGYDADFLAACQDDLTLSEEDIATSTVYVFDGVDAPAGFYRLVLKDDGVAELDALFVEPTAMGQGIGSRLGGTPCRPLPGSDARRWSGKATRKLRGSISPWAHTATENQHRR